MASIGAIGVMGLVAYLFFVSIASFADIVPVATLITTALCGAGATYVWYDEESNDLSTQGWVYLILGFWAAAGVLLSVACWLANISFDQTLAFPQALWQWRSADFPPSRADWARRLFLLGMALGPGVALIAIGSVVRGLLLWISSGSSGRADRHRPALPASRRRAADVGRLERAGMDDQRIRTRRSTVLSWTLNLLVFSLLAFIVLGPLLRNPMIDGVLSHWRERYYFSEILLPLAVVVALGLSCLDNWRNFRETGHPWELIRPVMYIVSAIVIVVFFLWKAVISV